MDSDDNSDKTPEMYHNSNSEDPSDGSIISYLQFQRPETPPEYRGQDEKDNPSIEAVSFIADNENPMKAEQNTEASSELPSSSPCQKECYDHGDEMETQQSSEDFPQTDYDTMPEAQQLSKASMAEMILGDNTSELQDSNLENSTVLQHTKNATDLQTSTGAYPTDLHVQAEGDSQDLAEGEKSTEIQALSEDNSSDLGHTNKENTPELEIDSDKNITSQKVLQNISNEEVPEFKPPMGDNSTLKHSSAEITAENIVEVQHPREESSRELEYPREYEIAEQPNKENMTELEQCDENISKLTHPREETQESFITETPELENSNANISELTHPKEESFITETPELEQCNEKISELTHPREESIITETSGLEQCNEKISELTHPREETQESIITETPELELCNANISELTHPREESIITETRYPSGESESGMQSPREEKINELECFSEDKTIELQLPKVETIAKLETEEDELMGPDQLSELEKPAEENSSGIRVDIGDNNTELQPLSDMNRSVAVGDTEVECQLNENVKSELEQSREDNEMDTQPRDCEDKSVSIISDKVVEVSNGDELGSTLQPIQHGISHVHEKPELDKSELEQPTAEKPLAERETVAITLAGETNESDTCKLPTLSPKLEPQEIQLVDEAKVQEKQSNAAPVEPESKLDHLVIPAPEIAPSVVMQEHMSNEEYRSWKEVLESPEDFEAWVKLLALAEKHENPVVIRETFDRFLKLYPYCYGYWRKFADLVLRLQGWPHAQQILEIGVYSIPLSIDLWLHYAALSYNQGIDYTAVTALYDRSLEIAGYEYRSDLLWEAAIHYQESQNQMLKVFALLRQLIATPTQQYKKHFHKYETFLNTRSICELLSEEEFKTIGEQTKYTRLANESGKSLDEKVRDCLLDQGRQVHAATEEEIGLRQSFEEKIKRPYFHVQPLEETQLQTWRSYLDFEIARKYKDRIVFLFERCMIVCALYEEMWIKYAKFLGSEYSEETRAVFQRGACYIPKSVAIHLEWSLFEESLGQLDRARELLHTIDQKIPDLIETRLRFIAFELRHGNKGKVDELYKQSVSQSQKQFQKNSSHSQDSKLLHDVYNYWVTKYVFFLQRHRNEHAVAKKMLFDAIEKDKNNSTLYFYLVDLELNQQPLDKDKVMSVLNKAIHAPLEQEVKEAFCIRKLNWAEEMGIPLDYRVMNELKTLRDKSTATPSPSAHALRKRPNEYESDLYTKHSRVDSSTFPSEQNQQNMNYQQSRDPDQQQYPPYYQGYQGGEMGESNQQWSQQYNYQQDWGYQHQYHNQ